MVKKNKRNKINFIKRERSILWLVVIILIVTQAISAYYLIKLWNFEAKNDTQNIAELINKSEQKRYLFPVIDVSENRVYIPEARVYLPLNDATRELRYDYFSVSTSKSLYLSTSGTVGAQRTKDDYACDKVVSILQSTEQMSSSFSLMGEIQPTKDGLRYIFEHPKDTCSIYYGTVQEDLVSAAKQIKNY